jgi:hypothetical protein
MLEPYHSPIFCDPDGPERPSPPALIALLLSMSWWRRCHVLRALGEQTLREHEWAWDPRLIDSLNELTSMLEAAAPPPSPR